MLLPPRHDGHMLALLFIVLAMGLLIALAH